MILLLAGEGSEWCGFSTSSISSSQSASRATPFSVLKILSDNSWILTHWENLILLSHLWIHVSFFVWAISLYSPDFGYEEFFCVKYLDFRYLFLVVTSNDKVDIISTIMLQFEQVLWIRYVRKPIACPDLTPFCLLLNETDPVVLWFSNECTIPVNPWQATSKNTP